MDNQTRILIGAIVALTLIAAGLYLAPAVNEKVFQPRIDRALVAIEVAGSGIADVGVVSIEAGTAFTLHAVLEATSRSGQSVYYTRAPGLRFLDPSGVPQEPVPASALRPWNRRGIVKVRWFTVEGRQPMLRLDPGQGLEALIFEPYFRADWPSNWSVPGLVEPAFDDRLSLGSRVPAAELDFGTQRYYVRVELYRDEKEVLAAERFASPGPEELRADPSRFSTVVASLSGPAGPASRVFGLTQIEPSPDSSSALRSSVSRLVEQRLAFTRLSVLRDQLGGVVGDGAVWNSLDLSTEPVWEQDVVRGDLLRVGARVVVIYADRGQQSVLDYEDLCFDFAAGAIVRALGDVFSGEDSVLEHLPLGR